MEWTVQRVIFKNPKQRGKASELGPKPLQSTLGSSIGNHPPKTTWAVSGMLSLGLVANSILVCRLFTITYRCKKTCFCKNNTQVVLMMSSSPSAARLTVSSFFNVVPQATYRSWKLLEDTKYNNFLSYRAQLSNLK